MSREYFQRRAEQERQLAKRSSDTIIARIHHQLLEHYSRLAAGDGGTRAPLRIARER